MVRNSDSPKRIFEHLIAQGIWQLLWWGGSTLIVSILPSIFVNIQMWQKVLLTIGLFAVLSGIVFFILYRKEVRKREWKRVREEFILAKIPDLIELPKTLWALHKKISEISKSLENRDMSEDRIKRCNDDYVERVRSGRISSIFGTTETMEANKWMKYLKNINKKIKHPLDKRFLLVIDTIGDIMDNHKMGISAYLQKKESGYTELKDKTDIQQIKADEQSKKLIKLYLAVSYGGNSIALLFAYCLKLKSLGKEIRQLPGLDRPLPRVREDIDEFMQIFLAHIQDSIEKGVELT